MTFFAYPPRINISLGIKTDEITEFFTPYLGKLLDGEINAGENYEKILNISLRECIRGEVYDNNIHACVRCDFKKFSLNPNDNECTVCTAESIDCEGGDVIKMKMGYWRSSRDSLEFHICEPNKDSCL